MLQLHYKVGEELTAFTAMGGAVGTVSSHSNSAPNLVFRDERVPYSQLTAKRPIQHRRQQRVQLRLGGIVQGDEFVQLGSQVI